ncbi:MAG: DUF1841 family protein [Nitrospirota bacterium]
MLFDRDNQWRYTGIAEKRRQNTPLDGEDELIAQAMDLHPELDPLWELGELSATPQEVNGTVVNPFIHTALHVLVEKQLQTKSPPEIVDALNVLLRRGVDRHEAVHAIASVYADLYFTTFRRGQQFEELTYVELLKQLVAE